MSDESNEKKIARDLFYHSCFNRRDSKFEISYMRLIEGGGDAFIYFDFFDKEKGEKVYTIIINEKTGEINPPTAHFIIKFNYIQLNSFMIGYDEISSCGIYNAENSNLLAFGTIEKEKEYIPFFCKSDGSDSISLGHFKFLKEEELAYEEMRYVLMKRIK